MLMLMFLFDGFVACSLVAAIVIVLRLLCVYVCGCGVWAVVVYVSLVVLGNGVAILVVHVFVVF